MNWQNEKLKTEGARRKTLKELRGDNAFLDKILQDGIGEEVELVPD